MKKCFHIQTLLGEAEHKTERKEAHNSHAIVTALISCIWGCEVVKFLRSVFLFMCIFYKFRFVHTTIRVLSVAVMQQMGSRVA